MNARVFLVVVLTGLFMTAWNADQAAEQQFLAQRAELRAAMAVAHTNEHESTISADAVAVSVHNSDTLRREQTTDSCFRPNEMAVGSYRAVSEHGETLEFTVDEQSDSAVRDFYIADSPEGVRWYFVRLQSGE